MASSGLLGWQGTELATDQTSVDCGRLTGLFLSAWLLFPVVLLVCSCGCGLLVRHLSAGSLSLGMVLPGGFALMVVVCAFATSITWLAPAAGAIVAVLALLGYALAKRAGTLRLPQPRRTKPWRASAAWLWPTLAALTAFVSIGGPAFLTGTPTWTGYTRIVDIAFQMDFAKHLADAGHLTPPLNSSYHVMIHKLTTTGYPGGGQATLGAMAGLIRTDVPWCYQTYLAFAAAMGTLAIFSLLGRITDSGLLRAVGAAVAIQPNLLYGYALEGGIKELTTVTLLMVVIALLVERLPGEGKRRSVLPLAVASSASFAAFSFGIAPWLGIVFAGLLVVTLAPRSANRRHVAECWGLFAAVAIVLSIPTIVAGIKLFTLAGEAIGGVVELGLGNLAAAVPDWSSAGVWLTGDYRYPLVHTTATHTFDVVVIALAVLGILFALRRRRWALGILGICAPIVLYYWIAHTGPWIQFKAFTITGTIALVLAFAGAAALRELGPRWIGLLGWSAVVVIAGVVLYGNALIYHDTSLAPAARYRDLAAIGKRYAGQGSVLFPAFDEYSEYFLREENETDIVNPAYGRFPLAQGVSVPPGGISFSWDLNQIAPWFVQTFPLIVTPRSPVASRAPANYDLIERTRYFDVWRRNRPTGDVVMHLPLSNMPYERTQSFCRSLVQVAHNAGPGAEVAYAQQSVASVVSPAQSSHPDYWTAAGPDTVIALGAGTVQSQFTLARSGHYSIWLNGSVGRPLNLYLDGKRLANIGYEERYPNQFLLLTDVTLAGGQHTLRIVRGNGSLHPGSGDPPSDTVGRTIGAIVFDLGDSTSERVYVARASEASRVCTAPVGYEWLEVLKPGGAPPNALSAKP